MKSVQFTLKLYYIQPRFVLKSQVLLSAHSVHLLEITKYLLGKAMKLRTPTTWTCFVTRTFNSSVFFPTVQ